MGKDDKKIVTAGLIVIGDEILSGRVDEKNVSFIAKHLTANGVELREVSIIPDQEELIVSVVREFKDKYTYVFTTGGIGPTHDDKTINAIGKAFAVPLVENKEAMLAVEAVANKWGTELNHARKKMAILPEGCQLILNKVSGVPSFVKDNVFVLAGIPDIMQSMLLYAIEHFNISGKKKYSQEISINAREGDLAEYIGALQDRHPNVVVGIYPLKTAEESWACSVIFRGYDSDEIGEIVGELVIYLEEKEIRHKFL